MHILQNEELSLVKTSLEKDQKKIEELKLELETKVCKIIIMYIHVTIMNIHVS